MFSGIVESTTKVLDCVSKGGVLRLRVERPPSFEDIKLGDSVATQGICLTVVEFSPEFMEFDVGAETLRVTNWDLRPGSVLNLERSLRLSDRVHGHLMTGHIDEVGRVLAVQDVEGGRGLRVSFSEPFAPLVWKKGSITINGVSLTVNEVGRDFLEVWLIPETLKRTNLGLLRVNDLVHLEADSLAKFFARQKDLNHESN